MILTLSFDDWYSYLNKGASHNRVSCLFVSFSRSLSMKFKLSRVFKIAVGVCMLLATLIRLYPKKQVSLYTKDDADYNIPQSIPPILHQSWKTTELPAVSAYYHLYSRSLKCGGRLGSTIIRLGFTNSGRMMRTGCLFQLITHGFSTHMIHYQRIFTE